MSVNKATILGHLGNDPQIKTFDNGGTVAQFTVATTTRGFTTQNGTQVPERTEWHNIIVRNKLAEVAGKYLRKGSKIYLEGEIRTRSYTDQNQQTRYITEIHVSTFEMLSPNPNAQPQQQGTTGYTGTGSAVDDYQQRQAAAGQSEEPDDLPF